MQHGKRVRPGIVSVKQVATAGVTPHRPPAGCLEAVQRPQRTAPEDQLLASKGIQFAVKGNNLMLAAPHLATRVDVQDAHACPQLTGSSPSVPWSTSDRRTGQPSAQL